MGRCDACYNVTDNLYSIRHLVICTECINNSVLKEQFYRVAFLHKNEIDEVCAAVCAESDVIDYIKKTSKSIVSEKLEIEGLPEKNFREFIRITIDEDKCLVFRVEALN